MTLLDLMEAQIDKHPRRTEPAKSKDRKGLHPALKLAPVAANLLDAYTTQQALKRPGAREGNPVMAGVAGNPAALYGSKAALGVLTALAADELAKEGGLIKKPHRTLAQIMAAAATAAPLVAAARNASIAKGRK